jgi:hypothetical protein
MKSGIIKTIVISIIILIALIALKSLLPWVFIAVSMLGWVLVLGIVLCLTGLQTKILKGIGKGLFYSKKFKVPFVGNVEVESNSGSSLILKITKK